MLEEKTIDLKLKLKFKFLDKPKDIENIKADLETEFKKVIAGYLKNNLRVIGKVSNVKKDDKSYGVLWELNL